jgi:hypothetical protein
MTPTTVHSSKRKSPQTGSTGDNLIGIEYGLWSHYVYAPHSKFMLHRFFLKLLMQSGYASLEPPKKISKLGLPVLSTSLSQIEPQCHALPICMMDTTGGAKTHINIEPSSDSKSVWEICTLPPSN